MGSLQSFKLISGCGECPFKKYHYGHGESFDFCSHPHGPGSYANILPHDMKTAYAKWCPLAKNDFTLGLKDKKR